MGHGEEVRLIESHGTDHVFPMKLLRRHLTMMCKKFCEKLGRRVIGDHPRHQMTFIHRSYASLGLYLIYGSSYGVKCKHTCLLPLITTPLQAENILFGISPSVPDHYRRTAVKPSQHGSLHFISKKSLWESKYYHHNFLTS